MSDSLNERVAALERRAPRRGGWRLIGLGVLLAVLTGNLWLMVQLRDARQAVSRERQFWIVGHAAYTAAQRAEAFVSLAESGNTEWKGARLDGLNLFGLRLPGAALNFADFTGSDLRQASLAGARMNRAVLARTDLTAADLSQAYLAGAEVVLARMIGANCRQANFSGGTLEQVEARNAVFVAADLSECDLLMADFSGANLSGADLSGAQLESTRFTGANLQFARVPGVVLKEADFTGANWWRARGFTSEQLLMLKEKFSPDERAPKELRDDFELWLHGLGGDAPGAAN